MTSVSHIGGGDPSALPTSSDRSEGAPSANKTAASEIFYAENSYEPFVFNFCDDDEKKLAQSFTNMSIQLILRSPSFKKTLEAWRTENKHDKVTTRLGELAANARRLEKKAQDEGHEINMPGMPLDSMDDIEQVIKAILVQWRADGTFENCRLKAAIYWLQSDAGTPCRTVSDDALAQEKKAYSDVQIRSAEKRIDANVDDFTDIRVLIYQFALLEGFGPTAKLVERLRELELESSNATAEKSNHTYV
jgi:hypothetical protein